MKNLIYPIILLITLISCNGKTEITKTSATGKINSVLVIVDNDKWQGEVGDALRDVLAKSLNGFPQDEPRFRLSQISSRNFNRMLKHSRNIVSVDFKDKNSFKILKNKFAAPQRIVVINAKDKENLVQILKEHEEDIIKTFNENDIKTAQQLQLKKYWEPNTIKTLKNNGISIKIPYAFLKVQDTLNYAYFRKDIPEGYQILQIYTIPIQSEADFTGENIIKYRNEKGKQFVPGELDGSFMKTEEVYFPIQYKNKTMLGRKTIETHGVWEMEVSTMAGPFLNYAVLDKKNNRIIVVEGDVYAPNISKRDYLFELEALLKTLEIND
jgi:hypothetical protein